MYNIYIYIYIVHIIGFVSKRENGDTPSFMSIGQGEKL